MKISYREQARWRFARYARPRWRRYTCIHRHRIDWLGVRWAESHQSRSARLIRLPLGFHGVPKSISLGGRRVHEEGSLGTVSGWRTTVPPVACSMYQNWAALETKSQYTLSSSFVSDVSPYPIIHMTILDLTLPKGCLPNLAFYSYFNTNSEISAAAINDKRVLHGND